MHNVSVSPNADPEPQEGPSVGDGRQQLGRRFSRRALLGAGAAALVAVGGGAFGIDQAVESSSTPAPTPPYRSRPDLRPPPITTLVPADGTAPGLIFAAPIAGASQFGPMIVDNLGQLVWFRPLPQGKATNIQVQQYQGRSILAWWQGEIVFPGYGRGECILADHAYREITRVRAGNGLEADLHELFITPEDTALITAYRVETADLTSVGGPRRGKLLNSLLQEVDIATGRVLFEWNAHEHVALAESYLSPDTSHGAFDFFHINSIDVDVDGNLLVSGRHTWTVYKIDRHTGAVLWRLNGKLSNFEVAPRAQFAFQHHVRHHPNTTLSIFDDGGGPPNVHTRSRGIMVALDMATNTATLVHEYLPDPEFLATSQGSVQLLPNGNVFIGWGAEPYWSEYATDGRMRFDARMPTRGDSYRAFRFPWVGTPDSRPAVAAVRNGPRRVTVYASWNGATEVAQWQIQAGNAHGAMTTVAAALRSGFETAVPVTTGLSHVAARALDRRGQVLGTSVRLAV